MQSELRIQCAKEIPIVVVRAIYDNVLPKMCEWARAERVNWFTDVEAMSVQRNENRRDWVLHVSTTDGRLTHFIIRMETLN